MRKLILVLALALGGALFYPPSPVEASGPVVMVESHVRGSQDANLRWAIKYADRFTMSRMVFGRCVPQRRCIVVHTSHTRAAGTAWAAWQGTGRQRVSIDANPAGGDRYMKRLWAHEIGHAFFLGHSEYRTNLMYPTLHKRNGDLVPVRYTDYQRSILRRH